MKRRVATPVDLDERPRDGESFLQRFNRRKLEARNKPTVADTTPPDIADDVQRSPDDDLQAEAATELTDADMPPLDTLDESSDYSGFLSEKVSETLRRAALRKLFHSSAFNVIDDMDDYAEDFTTFGALGDIVTSDMRHQVEVEARKRAEAVKQAMLEGTDVDNTEPDENAVDKDADAAMNTQVAITDESRLPDAEHVAQAPAMQEDPHAD
jgi:hypothetical protein